MDAFEAYRVGQGLSGHLLGKVAWVPFAIIAGLVVYSHVEGPQLASMWPVWAAAVGAATLSFVVPRRLRNRAWPASAAGEQEYELRASELVVRGSASELHSAWSTMKSVAETADHFLFQLDSRVVLALPKRAIPSDGELEAVRQRLDGALGTRARLSTATRPSPG